MSEIAKCPLCGLEMSRYVYRQREVISCDSEDCSFRCNNADLPRIAAAMELAKAKVLIKKASTGDEIFFALRNELEKRERVIEVFK